MNHHSAASELTPGQIRKGLLISVCFVILRLIIARLWSLWFNMAYSLAQIPIDLLLGWFFGFAIAAFTEETIFRGFIMQALAQKVDRRAANLLQAALFAITHFGMAPLGSLGDELFILISRFAFGLLCGWLKIKRGTLLPAGIVHAFIG